MSRSVGVSVILPTYQERGSLEHLYPALSRALAGFSAELVVVDDGSPDGTAEFARSLQSPVSTVVVERGRKLGLASAAIVGFERSAGETIVVMDADGSHPPEAVPTLVRTVTDGEAEFALGSRWVPGGSAPGLTRGRRLLSAGAAVLARPLVAVRDPMSGFFAFRRSILERGTLAPLGYKIGLEVLVKCRPAPVVEVPIVFRPRTVGESKLGRGEIAHYLRHVSRLYSWRLFGSRRASSTR
ncbi:MAG TPA: polyprenol monophosphomannose synthase [Thermoplasmata archaeon]|nr:polyprenol monophosphomannose synthase [Thermoplasmata archaeon]